MKLLSLFLLIVINFNLIKSETVFISIQQNDTMYVTLYGSFNHVVVSRNPSIPSVGFMKDYNETTFSVYNGSLLYDLSSLVLNSNTSNPYKIQYKYYLDGLKYTTYFNLFAPLDYCYTLPYSNQSSVYQSCIKRETGTVFANAGGFDKPIAYNISDINLFKINYQSNEFSYGCYRNTWFNIKCNKLVDFIATRMTMNYCDYEIFIESKSACPINTEIPSTRYNSTTITFKLTEDVLFTQYQDFYFNGELNTLEVSPFTYLPTPTPTPTRTPTETPTYTPTLSPLPTSTPINPKIRCELTSHGFQVISTGPIKCRGNGITFCEFPNGSTCCTHQTNGVVNCSTNNNSISCYGNNIECNSLDLTCSYHNTTNNNNLFVNGIQHYSNIYDQ